MSVNEVFSTAGVAVASTTSAPTPVVVGGVVAASPALKPVPSSIFLPLRLSWFLFSFGVSSALIDFKIEVNELSSFTFLSTSCWVAVFALCNAFASSINFSACSICDCCFLFERIRFTCVCRSVISFCNSVVTGSSFVPSTTGSATLFFWIIVVSLFVVNATSSCTFVSVLSGLDFWFSWVSLFVVTTVVPLTTSLASTWCPRKKPTPISTLAAPNFNFFMEYFSNLRPAFCWFTYSLFFPTIFHLKIK